MGDVGADNDDGCEGMQVRVYACLPDSLLIYCLDRPLSLTKCKHKTHYTFKIMTLSVENPSQGYVVGCNCCEADPPWLFWRRRAQLRRMHAEGGSTGGAMQPNALHFDPACHV